MANGQLILFVPENRTAVADKVLMELHRQYPALEVLTLPSGERNFRVNVDVEPAEVGEAVLGNTWEIIKQACNRPAFSP